MSNIQYSTRLLQASRQNMLGLLEGFSLEQLQIIPPNFNNHLLWNMAHVVVTQQLLVYGLSQTPFVIEKELIDKYRKGTFPEGKADANEWAYWQLQAIKTIEQMEKDYENKIFGEFRTYPTSYGVELNSIDDAIHFNNAHEAMHLGQMKALVNLIDK